MPPGTAVCEELAPALVTWVAVRRNLKRNGPIETELDAIDPGWRKVTRAPNRPTEPMLAAARDHVAEHGTLDSATGSLSRWLSATRYTAARVNEPSPLHQELDRIDPGWRRSRG